MKNDIYQHCFTPDCVQILLRDEVKKEGSFSCDLCGKWYCLKCKESHEGFSCQGDMDKKAMEKLGIKKCPSCSEGIYKDGGCRHMTCKKCGTHFCWLCLASYRSAK